MKHEFDSETKNRYYNCFSWDKERETKIFEALSNDSLSTLRILMQDSEESLLESLVEKITPDEVEIFNAKIDTLEKMRKCYAEVEQKILWYLDKEDKKLKYDVHI